MKRIIIYIGILILTILSPVKRLDVARLEPVEVLYLYKEENEVVLSSDTEAEGQGVDALVALQDMKERTAGVIYLDTAKYLLVSPDALSQIELLRPQLKSNTKLCMAEKVELKNAAKFLNVHGKLPCLRQWTAGKKLPFWNGEKILEKRENNA